MSPVSHPVTAVPFTLARRRLAFTLVELLVVIGIIAVLVSILLPSLAKVRRQAAGVACLSNMRQLANAVIMYSTENKFWMPCRATASQAGWGPGGPQKTGGSITNTANWIAWEYVTDPYQGGTGGFGTAGDQNVTYSALAPFLNMPYTSSSYNGTGGLPISNDVNNQYKGVFVCPGDDPQQRPKSMTVPVPMQQNYFYSYGMNAWIDNPPSYPESVPSPTGQKTARIWGLFNGKLSSIGNASDIVLMIDQDPKANTSGEVTLTSDQWAVGLVNTCNPVHYGNNNLSTALVAGQVNQDGYGNASFCDGHAAQVSRKDCVRSLHSGDPIADPTGF